MLRRKGKRIVLSLALVMIFISLTSYDMRAEEDHLRETEQVLLDISQEEREILDSLFIKAQELEELDRERDRIILDIKDMKLEIDDMDGRIQEETANYEDKLDLLKQVLRSYQRMGPGSYIEIILEAENINNLLKRINTLRDLTKNTGDLLDSIQGIKDRLLAEKANLDQRLAILEEREVDLARTIEDGKKKVQDMEDYLISLAGDREYYEERLDKIMKLMDELAILIQDTAGEFANIIKNEDLPEDNVKLRLTSRGMKGTITEDVFNDIVKSNEKLPEIVFSFYKDLVELNFPQNNLMLQGIFTIIDGQTINYQMEKGSFYGFVLTKETIDELFKDNDLVFHLEPLLWKNTIESIEIMEGYMELGVNIRLF